MLKPFYGEIMTGRLSRLAYLGYFVLLTAVILGAAFGLGEAAGLWERLGAGQGTDAWTLVRQALGLGGLFLGTLLLGALVLAYLNMTAKRIRDIGLPAWSMMLTILVIGLFGAIIGGSQLTGGVYLLIFLSMLILPTDSFGKIGTDADDRG